jgi:ABC-type spermidine/putrescine transport system permease subunit I
VSTTTRDAPAAAPEAEARDRRTPRHALLLPTGVWTTLFFVAPLALLVIYSFGEIDLLTYEVELGFSLNAYGEIFDSLYLKTILRSLALSVGATLACLVIGFPVAYAISRQRGSWQTILLIAVMVPFWTSFVVRTYALVNLLDDDGPIADVLQAVGIIDGSLRLLYTPWAIGIGMVYAYLPLMILPLFVALERIDPALISAATDLGAPPRRVFRRVVLPMAAPGMVAGCVLVGVPATGEYVVPAILGGEKTLMYGNVVADQFLGIGDYPFGSALAVSLTVIITVVLVLTRRRTAAAEAVA